MTQQELELLLLEWVAVRGGIVSEEEMDSFTAVLEEHFTDPDTATLQEARIILGIKGG